MKVSWKRPASFALLFAIYLAAAAGGCALYFVLPGHPAVRLLAADTAATVFVFVFSVLFSNASVYDPYWSVQPVVIAGVALFCRPVSAAGLLLFGCVCVWGVRLTANWAVNFGGMACQDWRYTLLRDTTGRAYPLINFVGIHMVPTLVVYLCTLPVLAVMAEAPPLNAGAVIFALLSLAAVGLELSADLQMLAYRRNRTTTFIRRGLWKYARHPNYLGEILMWWSVGLYAVCLLPRMWYLTAGAVVNTLLFSFVSIPMTERRQSRKEGWEEYKRETRLLLPLKRGR